MPQLGQGRFGPLKSTVTLDAGGNGTISFQPNGGIARITNGFVQVSSTTLQAVATVYRGQVDSAHAINRTNSGSTGAAFTGVIDVMDGETLFVRWVGGDVGATATLTLVGYVIPFNQAGSEFQLHWDDPIAAGDGSLIYPAVKSPNFVTGVSGWKIGRDGSVEFNDGVFRGSLIAGNGVVTIDATGVRVNQPGGQTLYMNITQGFIIDAGTMGFIQLEIDTNGEPRLALRPQDSAIGGTYDDGIVRADYISSGGQERPYLELDSPEYNALARGQIIIYGERSNNDPPLITANAQIQADETILVGPDLGDLGRGWVTGASSGSNSAAVGNAFTSVLTCPATNFYPGRAYKIELGGRLATSVANMAPEVALSSSTGLTLCFSGRVSTPTIDNYGMPGSENVFIVGGASTLNRTISLRITSNIGGQTVTHIGPRWFNVYDVGAALNFTNTVSMV